MHLPSSGAVPLAAHFRRPHPQAPGHPSGEGASTVLPPLHTDDACRPAGGGDEPTRARRLGKFLISPLIKAVGHGWFASSVSIRSGSGSATTDRVLRLPQAFRSATEAAMYAHEEALRWIVESTLPIAPGAAMAMAPRGEA